MHEEHRSPAASYRSAADRPRTREIVAAEAPPAAGVARRVRLYAAVLVVVGIVVWATGLDGVFLYDDYDSIALNPHIHTLWPLSEAMSRPLADAAETVSTRPLLSLTFALNYAVHGLARPGYHVVNIAVHVACALLLLGLLRRTLLLARRQADPARGATLAFVITLLWLVHPLHTSAVTYIVQRAELLGGLCVLMALYAAVRGATSETPLAWYAAAVAACWVGAGAKETVAAVPLLVLVHHATFVDGSYRGAMAKRWPLYLAMAASWSVLWALRSADTGTLVQEGRGLDYALTQPSAVLRYLRLSVWPHPLALSYDWPAQQAFSQVVLPALVVGGALLATAVGLVRRRWWAFAGACFFAILAPSSSVFGLTQRIMEHRMYLPLAAVLSVVVIGTEALLAGITPNARPAGARAHPASAPLAAMAVVLAGVTAALAGVTVARNRDYADEIRFWQKNVATQPSDSIAQLQLGRAYLRVDAIEPARRSFEQAARIGPPFAPVLNDLGRTLIIQGDLAHAESELGKALELDPSLAVAHHNLGVIAERRGRLDDAASHYRRALELDPTLDLARQNLARALEQRGDLSGAAATLASALERSPTDSATSLKLAGVLEREGRLDDAQASYERVLAAEPRNLVAANALATLLARRGQDAQAVRRFEAVLAIDERNIDALRNLGALHAMQGRDADALRVLERAATADPNASGVNFNLGLLREKQGDLERAAEHFSRELGIQPQFAPAHAALARVLEQRGERDGAARHYAAALTIDPDMAEAREGLRRLGAGDSTGGS